MAAATTPRVVTSPVSGMRWKFDVKGGETLIAGTMVGIDSSERAVNAAASGHLAVLVYAHATEDEIDNSAGGDGDETVELYAGDWGPFANSAAVDEIASDDRGKPCFLVDNQTVALTSNGGARSRAGVVVDVTARGVFVRFDYPAGAVRMLGVGGAYTKTYNTPNRTIANPTASAIGATLTDNSTFEPTHNDTLAANAAPVTLTDSSTFEPTHDDTLAANAAPVTLTDNSGFEPTHNNTLAASATPAALLVGTLGGASDGTMETVGDTSTGDRSTQIMNNFQDLFVKVNELRTQLDAVAQNVSDVAAKVVELVSAHSVSAQNVSDVAAKVVELVSAHSVSAQNTSDVAAKVVELVTAANALVADDLDNRQTLVAVTTDLENGGAAA